MNFLKKRFHRYYLHSRILLPERFERREYAFMLFDEDTMHRHMAFSSREQLSRYLHSHAPAHVYYSSAYYRTPSAATMREKQWMGADLIFDLDADHLPQAEQLSYTEALVEVKKEMQKLLSFLHDDFGFGKNETRVYFSGGRGYHCHVSHKAVLSLGSQERREIIDYIMGRGLDLSEIVRERSIPREGDARYGQRFTHKTIEIDPFSGGWTRRILEGLVAFYERIRHMEREDAIRELTKIEGIGRKTAEELYGGLTDERIARIKRGKLDQATGFKRIAIPLMKNLAVSLTGEADEPVTTDIKRLIRLPGSLHGKTGLRVTPVDIDDMEGFDPLRDAVVFGDEPVKITINKPVEITMNEQTFKLEKGDAEVPEYLAVFLVARRNAVIKKSME